MARVFLLQGMIIRMQTAPFFKDKNVMITGHTGFIGSWLTKQLVMLNANVCGYSLDPPTHPNMFDALGVGGEITDIRGDVRNRETLCKTVSDFQPSIVFHLAAQPIVLESYDNPVDTFDINVNGTVNLLNELRKIDGVKTIVVVTSDKSYRNNENGHTCYIESDALGGKDPYSASKSCQDIVVNSFRDNYFSTSGIGISSVRAGNVIGGGDWAKYRIVPDIVRGIENNETIKIRNPNSVRPWQHVMEPISGMLTLAQHMWGNTSFSGSWNIGPDYGREVTVRELVEKFIGYYGNGRYEIDRNSGIKEATYLQLDISKVKKELNWFPRYDFEKSVKDSVEWYKGYYSGADIAELTKVQIKEFMEKNMVV